MARLLDTLPAFEAYARKAGVESPLKREFLWRDEYRAAHPEVFAAFDAAFPSTGGLAAVVKELSRVRQRVEEAAPVMRGVIEEVDPRIPEALGLPPEPAPVVHVLMVGTFATNAAVGPLGDDVAVFHCLEWFQTAEGARALVGHEGTHAWHQTGLDAPPPEDDLAWMTFSEGLAVQASRAVAPGLPEIDYFWYGHPEVEDWLPWCQANHGELLKHFRASLDIPEAVETFFGGGLVDGKWRVGFYVADALVAGLGRTLPELAAMSVEDGRAAIRAALDQPGG